MSETNDKFPFEIRPGITADEANRTPLGVIPKWLWLEHRANAINDAIIRYTEAGYPINRDWIRELKEIGFDPSTERIEIGLDHPSMKVTAPFPITNDEIIQMSQYFRPSAVWKKAFDLYNVDQNNRPLSINCMPCYHKVLSYIIALRLSIK